MKRSKQEGQNPRLYLILLLERWMLTIISLILLAGGLYVILSGNYDEATQKWAYGITGSILGYWFRGDALTKALISEQALPYDHSTHQRDAK